MLTLLLWFLFLLWHHVALDLYGLARTLPSNTHTHTQTHVIFISDVHIRSRCDPDQLLMIRFLWVLTAAYMRSVWVLWFWCQIQCETSSNKCSHTCSMMNLLCVSVVSVVLYDKYASLRIMGNLDRRNISTWWSEQILFVPLVLLAPVCYCLPPYLAWRSYFCFSFLV